MVKSGFNTRYNGEPIPPRSAPYKANFKQACTDTEKLAKAIQHMPVQTFKSANPVSFYTKGATDEKADTKTACPKVTKKLDISNPST